MATVITVPVHDKSCDCRRSYVSHATANPVTSDLQHFYKSVLEDAPQIEDAYQLSVEIATALGLGAGCDADDDDESALWLVMQP